MYYEMSMTELSVQNCAIIFIAEHKIHLLLNEIPALAVSSIVRCLNQ